MNDKRILTPPHISTLILLAGVGAMTMNIFLTALPDMAAEFNVSYVHIQLSITGYLLATAIAQPLIGAISDYYGRRPIMLLGIFIFILASIGASLAENFMLFMFCRLCQAGIVAGFVISRAAIRDQYKREASASMIGYVTMGMALVPMLAPICGGAITEFLGWRAVFYTMTIIGGFTFFVTFFDFGETNFQRADSLRQQFQQYPVLLISKRFWGYTATLAFASGSFFAYLGAVPFIGNYVFGLNDVQLGAYLGIAPLGYMLGNGISGRFAAQLGVERMISVGAFVTMIGAFLTIGVALLGNTHPLGFFGFTIAIGLGNGLLIPSANAALMEVRPDLAGSATGLSGSIMTMLGAILAQFSGLFLDESAGVYPLAITILVISICCMITALWTLRRERQRG